MLIGNKRSIPFRQLGQYEDFETELYYNRFRYYNCETGSYISRDPIGLEGDNPNLYAYVWDSNTQIDVLGLKFTPDQQALIDLAKSTSNSGRTPISSADADVLLDWAKREKEQVLL